MTMENTYWSNKGKHQALSDAIRSIVPISGASDIEHVELLRSLNNVYYDVYNNGGCNRRTEPLLFIRTHVELFKDYLPSLDNCFRGLDKLSQFNVLKFSHHSCPDCDYGQETADCPDCNGSGYVEVREGDESDEEECDECSGDGDIEIDCAVCGGSGDYTPPSYLDSYYDEDEIKTFYEDLESIADAIIECVGSHYPLDVLAAMAKEA